MKEARNNTFLLPTRVLRTAEGLGGKYGRRGGAVSRKSYGHDRLIFGCGEGFDFPLIIC